MFVDKLNIKKTFKNSISTTVKKGLVHFCVDTGQTDTNSDKLVKNLWRKFSRLFVYWMETYSFSCGNFEFSTV